MPRGTSAFDVMHPGPVVEALQVGKAGGKVMCALVTGTVIAVEHTILPRGPNAFDVEQRKWVLASAGLAWTLMVELHDTMQGAKEAMCDQATGTVLAVELTISHQEMHVINVGLLNQVVVGVHDTSHTNMSISENDC